MNNPFLYIILLFLSIGFTRCSKQIEQQPLTIAAAANLQYVLPVLIDTFETLSGIKCQQVIGSSGKLTTQIQNGAPYDVFLSANYDFAMKLYQSGNAENKPKVYALGSLILWSQNDKRVLSLEDLSSEKIKHIVIANPKTAPYGFAAKEVLENLHLYSTVQQKLIVAESIAQVNQFILSSTENTGFTAKSSMYAQAMKTTGTRMEIPQKYYSPIRQAAILVKHKNAHPKAQAFYTFLFSAKAKKILSRFGYKMPNEQL